MCSRGISVPMADSVGVWTPSARWMDGLDAGHDGRRDIDDGHQSTDPAG